MNDILKPVEEVMIVTRLTTPVIYPSIPESGEWDHEPNMELFEHMGMVCMIYRHTHLFNLNGYVAVQEGHPLYGVDASSEGPRLDVHGGVTYANTWFQELPHYWWIGFDTAHAGDLCPGSHSMFQEMSIYRNLSYVKQQVKKLADQLGELGHVIKEIDADILKINNQ